MVKVNWQGHIDEAKRAEIAKEDKRWQAFPREAIAVKSPKFYVKSILKGLFHPWTYRD